MEIVSNIAGGIKQFFHDLNPFAGSEATDASHQITPKQDTIEVHGIELPAELVRQFNEKLGIPITSLSRGELEAALIEFSKDSRLIEDHRGTGFLDSLTLTSAEAREQKGSSHWRDMVGEPADHECSHCEREEKRRKEALLHPHLQAQS